MILSRSQATHEFVRSDIWTINEDERMLIDRGYEFKVCWIAADGKSMVTYQCDAIMANSFARDLPLERHPLLLIAANSSWASVDIVR